MLLFIIVFILLLQQIHIGFNSTNLFYSQTIWKMKDILKEGEGTINVMPPKAKEGPMLEDSEKQIQTKPLYK